MILFFSTILPNEFLGLNKNKLANIVKMVLKE